MWELNYKQSWAPKNWCFGIVVLEKTLESPLDCREIKPVHPKGNQSLVFIGRTDAEAETPIVWPPDVKNWLIGKDPDAGKNWSGRRRGWEDEVVGWHHWLNGHEFEQALGVGDGQGSLVCCNPWDCKRARHNWVTELNGYILSLIQNTSGAFFFSFHLCVKCTKLVFTGDTAEHLSSLYFPSLLPNRTAAFKSIHLSSLQPTSQENCPISIFRDGLDWYKNNSITTSSN